SGQNTGSAQARTMTNISENVEFINQMNQMFNYVQLPLKLSNSQAHGDLYVYTNKKNMAHRDGMLTAFLHLDMDHLGSLDVSISLQTEKNQVTTKFYLNEDSIALVEEHIGELTQRLSRKGYQCKSMVVEKDEDKTVLEHLEEQKAGTNAVLSYQTFDTRA
ncbi:MAG: flagellar hook-length control protein FliK, partial [Lachnospiraceae bacterium]|nr:flagellar hook-length control protein FliK [Lachnospiraceae bacterium]